MKTFYKVGKAGLEKLTGKDIPAKRAPAIKRTKRVKGIKQGVGHRKSERVVSPVGTIKRTVGVRKDNSLWTPARAADYQKQEAFKKRTANSHARVDQDIKELKRRRVRKSEAARKKLFDRQVVAQRDISHRKLLELPKGKKPRRKKR